MPYRPFTDQNCSIATALAIVGERWTLLVMRDVLFGRRRFAEIKRSLGVAPNILSDRLQQLVEHMQWGDDYATPPAGPPRVVVHATCGHDADLQRRCGHCGEIVERGDLIA